MLERLVNLYDANQPSNRFLGFERRNLIDLGGNSIVIYDGENVFKIYEEGRKADNHLSLEQIILYQEITNSLNQNWTIDNFPVIIVPIDEIGFFEPLKCPYSVSKFIEGQNLDIVFNHGTGIRNLQNELSRLGFNQDSLTENFSNLSKSLNDYLHVEGISISLLNVKFSSTNGEFIVTDLCAEIRNLKYTI